MGKDKKENGGWDVPITSDLPHARPEGLDPRKNGPFLDDIRAELERAYREARMKKAESNVD